MKKCSKCKIEKELSEFSKDKSIKDRLRSSCKSCNKEYDKEYCKKNSEKRKEYQKIYCKNNSEKLKENRKNNNKNKNEYEKKRIANDPLYKLTRNLRNRTRQAFKSKYWQKNNTTAEILGTSYEICAQNIENKFTEGMTWKNHREWHIDHIVPLSSATTEEELIILCHYTNLQPLWAADNLSKGCKIPI